MLWLRWLENKFTQYHCLLSASYVKMDLRCTTKRRSIDQLYLLSLKLNEPKDKLTEPCVVDAT